MIEVREVFKRHGERIVVDGVSLELPPGRLTAIIGPNGAGKSSLLSMMSRLVPMSAGTVTVGGLDVSRTPGDVLARRIAILRQDNHLGLRLTVRELVAFGRFPHSKGRLSESDLPHIDRALAYLELEPLADRFLDEISGGQRQRAFVAMVLCQDTECILLDEPLNSLDLRHAVSMMALLRRMVDELHRTVLVVLHDINFASCYADHIIAMKGGAVHCQGSPAHIVRADVLRSLYDVEVAVQEVAGQRFAVCLR